MQALVNKWPCQFIIHYYQMVVSKVDYAKANKFLKAEFRNILKQFTHRVIITHTQLLLINRVIHSTVYPAY